MPIRLLFILGLYLTSPLCAQNNQTFSLERLEEWETVFTIEEEELLVEYDASSNMHKPPPPPPPPPPAPPQKTGFIATQIVNDTGMPADQVYLLIKGLDGIQTTSHAAYLQFDSMTGDGEAFDVTLSPDISLSGDFSYPLSYFSEEEPNTYLLYLPQEFSGARIYFSIGQPLFLGLVRGDTGVTTITDPSGFSLRDPNYYTLYDKCEFTYNQPDVNPLVATFYINPTAVDFVGMPLTLELTHPLSELSASGIGLDRSSVLSGMYSVFHSNDHTNGFIWENSMYLPLVKPSESQPSPGTGGMFTMGATLRVASPNIAISALGVPLENLVMRDFPYSYLIDYMSFNYIQDVWTNYSGPINMNEIRALFDPALSGECYLLEGTPQGGTELLFTVIGSPPSCIFPTDNNPPWTVEIPTSSAPIYQGSGFAITPGGTTGNIPGAIIQRTLSAAMDAGLLPITFPYTAPRAALLDFTTPFVSDNSITVTIDGSRMYTVPYTTSSEHTLQLLADEIATDSAVVSASANPVAEDGATATTAITVIFTSTSWTIGASVTGTGAHAVPGVVQIYDYLFQPNPPQFFQYAYDTGMYYQEQGAWGGQGPFYDLYAKAVHSLNYPIYAYAYDDVLKQDGTLSTNVEESGSYLTVTLQEIDTATLTALNAPYVDETMYTVEFDVAGSLSSACYSIDGGTTWIPLTPGMQTTVNNVQAYNSMGTPTFLVSRPAPVSDALFGGQQVAAAIYLGYQLVVPYCPTSFAQPCSGMAINSLPCTSMASGIAFISQWFIDYNSATPLQSGDSITTTINGTALTPAIDYSETSNNTIQNIANQIATYPSVDAATPVPAANYSKITITCVMGTIIDAMISGAGAPNLMFLPGSAETEIELDGLLVAGNTITVTPDMGSPVVVSYSKTSDNTMQLLANEIAAIPEVMGVVLTPDVPFTGITLIFSSPNGNVVDSSVVTRGVTPIDANITNQGTDPAAELYIIDLGGP